MAEPGDKREDGMPIGTPFKKGESGNPAGRPKVKKLRFRLREFDEVAEAALIAGVRNGDPAMLKLFMAYRHGMPAQKLEHGGADGEKLAISLQINGVVSD